MKIPRPRCAVVCAVMLTVITSEDWETCSHCFSTSWCLHTRRASPKLTDGVTLTDPSRGSVLTFRDIVAHCVMMTGLKADGTDRSADVNSAHAFRVLRSLDGGRRQISHVVKASLVLGSTRRTPRSTEIHLHRQPSGHFRPQSNRRQTRHDKSEDSQ